MNTTLMLADLLSPAQLEQAHQALEGIIQAIDTEQDQELTRIHRLFAERRRVARREAILKVLQGETTRRIDPSSPTEAPDVEQTEMAELPSSALTTTIVHIAPLGLVDEMVEEVFAPADVAPAPKHMGVEEMVKPTPGTSETDSPQLPQCYTAAELASVMGVHKSSINNWHDAGLIGRIAGTGTNAGNPGLYEVADIDALRATILERQANKGKRGGEALVAYKAGKAMGTGFATVALPDLISQGQASYPAGFFVGYHRNDGRFEVFGMPLPTGLPSGWVVAAVVEPKGPGVPGWTCNIPTTVGALKPVAEQIKDLVMGQRKSGGDA